MQPELAQKSGAKFNSERSLAYCSEVYKDSKKHESLKERDRLRKAEERKKQKEMRNKNIALKAVYRIQEAKRKLSRTNETISSSPELQTQRSFSPKNIYNGSFSFRSLHPYFTVC